MINPNTCRVRNCNAVVVQDSGDLQILNNHVGGISNGDSVGTNVSTALVADDGLIRANSKTSWQIERALDDDGQWVGALLMVRVYSEIGTVALTFTAATKASAVVTVTLGPPFPPVTGPIGFSLA